MLHIKFWPKPKLGCNFFLLLILSCIIHHIQLIFLFSWVYIFTSACLTVKWERYCLVWLADVAAVETKLSLSIVSLRLCRLGSTWGNRRRCFVAKLNWKKTATALHLSGELPASVLPHKHAHTHTLTHTELLKGALLCIARQEETVAFHQCLMCHWKGQHYLLYLVSVYVVSQPINHCSEILYLWWNSAQWLWNAKYVMNVRGAL